MPRKRSNADALDLRGVSTDGNWGILQQCRRTTYRHCEVSENSIKREEPSNREGH